MCDPETERHLLLAMRLREARKLAGLSQGQTSKLLGMHRPTISEIEAGHRRVSADELAHFAELYDVSAVWLLGRTSDGLMNSDPKLRLAAHELSKLRPEDLELLLKLLGAMRDKCDI